MRKIRTLVVDDEPLARARIVNLLNQVDYISILGECKNGREALKAISTYKPDLVFLDHLGDTHHQLGQTEQAIQSWQKAIEVCYGC